MTMRLQSRGRLILSWVFGCLTQGVRKKAPYKKEPFLRVSVQQELYYLRSILESLTVGNSPLCYRYLKRIPSDFGSDQPIVPNRFPKIPCTPEFRALVPKTLPCRASGTGDYTDHLCSVPSLAIFRMHA